MNRITQKLSPSLEDYLEAVYRISLNGKIPRVKDISAFLKVKTPSVVAALKALERRGLVVHEKYGYIELTRRGEKEAERIYKTHMVLKQFFEEVLGVDSSIAEEDACTIEHYLNQDTFNRLVKFLEFIETCPNQTPFWLKSFHHYVEEGERPPGCGERNGNKKEQ